MSKNEEFYSKDGRIYHEGELVRREDPTPLGGLEPQEPPKKSRFWRWSGLFLTLLLIVIIAIGAFGYLSLKAAPLAQANGRTNILITGTDEVAELSDTIIIASIKHNSSNPEVALISLPRDLNVPIPEYGVNKINAAHSLGQSNPETTGIKLLEDTIEQTFDVPIHYRMQVDFKAAKVLVNAVGGVTVDVKHDIYDPYFPTEDYSGYKTYQIEAGTQHLNGTEALRYMRSRKTTSDYDRARRQQQVLAALMGKITQKGFLKNPNNVRQVIKAYRKYVKTSMNDLSALKLAFLLRDIEKKDVNFHVLSTDTDGLLVNVGGSNLLPQAGDYREVAEFIDTIFQHDGDTLHGN